MRLWTLRNVSVLFFVLFFYFVSVLFFFFLNRAILCSVQAVKKNIYQCFPIKYSDYLSGLFHLSSAFLCGQVAKGSLLGLGGSVCMTAKIGPPSGELKAPDPKSGRILQPEGTVGPCDIVRAGCEGQRTARLGGAEGDRSFMGGLTDDPPGGALTACGIAVQQRGLDLSSVTLP